MKRKTLITVMFYFTFFALAPKYAKSLNPVLIIPGTGGSRLEAKLYTPSVTHFYCSRTSDWYTLWPSLVQLIPPAINCWVENIMFLLSPSTHEYSNNLDVITRVPDPDGSTLNFEYLDAAINYGDLDYFHTLVETIVQAGGRRNVRIRGLPYDFDTPRCMLIPVLCWIKNKFRNGNL